MAYVTFVTFDHLVTVRTPVVYVWKIGSCQLNQIESEKRYLGKFFKAKYLTNSNIPNFSDIPNIPCHHAEKEWTVMKSMQIIKI
ncbi:MAG: hypothetical protein HQK53_09515 [Oligoflexia bacterium]|nr:hypothetical protein [Oligoflexia bacterium]